MLRWMLVVSLVLCTVRLASAELAEHEAPYACKAMPATAKISASFAPEVQLKDLVVWVMGFTCKNVVVDGEATKRAPRVTVIAPGKMTPKQALQLFVDAVEATGLAVQVKKDTIIVKLGPNMPKTCPDLAEAPVPSNAPGPTVRSSSDDIAASVQKIDDTHYELSRTAVDALLADPDILAKAARVVPTQKDGKPTGLKIYAIRPGSLYAKIGLVNGDTIHAINGLELTTAERVLEIITRLKTAVADTKTIAKRFDVALTRRGQSVEIFVTIK